MGFLLIPVSYRCAPPFIDMICRRRLNDPVLIVHTHYVGGHIDRPELVKEVGNLELLKEFGPELSLDEPKKCAWGEFIFIKLIQALCIGSCLYIWGHIINFLINLGQSIGG